MRGTDAGSLGAWVAAITSWRTQAAGAGVTLDQVNVTTSDGLPLTFVWVDAVTDDGGTVTVPAGWRVIAP